MPYFKDSQEMFQIQGALLDLLATHSEIGPELAKSNLIIRFELSEPEGLIIINCKEKPGESHKHISYFFGESNLNPDVTFVHSSDFNHEFWQGKVDIVSSIFHGRTEVKGHLPSAIKLLPLMKPISGIYQEVLYKIGRGDLVLK